MDAGVCKYWQASMDKSGDDNVRERLDILVQYEAHLHYQQDVNLPTTNLF